MSARCIGCRGPWNKTLLSKEGFCPDCRGVSPVTASAHPCDHCGCKYKDPNAKPGGCSCACHWQDVGPAPTFMDPFVPTDPADFKGAYAIPPLPPPTPAPGPLMTEKEYNGIAMSIKDSGERVKHTTGAVRDSAAGRGRYDLISPIMMERLAKHLEAGAQKYEERNWEKGLPLGRMFASLFRHSWQAFTQQTDEDHLAAIICNAMFILHTLEMIARGRLPAALNDLPRYDPPTGKPDRLDGKSPRETPRETPPEEPEVTGELIRQIPCEKCGRYIARVIRVGLTTLGGVYCRSCRHIHPVPSGASCTMNADRCHKCGNVWPECGHN